MYLSLYKIDKYHTNIHGYNILKIKLQSDSPNTFNLFFFFDNRIFQSDSWIFK